MAGVGAWRRPDPPPGPAPALPGPLGDPDGLGGGGRIGGFPIHTDVPEPAVNSSTEKALGKFPKAALKKSSTAYSENFRSVHQLIICFNWLILSGYHEMMLQI